MPTDLSQYIQKLRVVNTHEHQLKEDKWLEAAPRDIIQDLFSQYEQGDLVSSGMPASLLAEVTDATKGDIASRWNKLRPYWELIQFTGYGEAVGLHAEVIYDIKELNAASLEKAQPRVAGFRKPGERLRLLRDVANLDHIQTDDFCWPCLPDASGADFFYYDLSMLSFANATFKLDDVEQETGVRVTDPESLRRAITVIFEKYGPVAIAVKSQHAYSRTLAWRERTPAEAARAMEELLRDRQNASADARLCVGDFCIGIAAELCGQHNLPFKIHTGHYAGNGTMQVHRIAAGNLCGLLIKYPGTRFVLMHIAYPYSDELVSIIKHFPNAYADLCWAWSIDPYTTMDFVRRCLHAVPLNKLFGYGGDTFWPTRGVVYAMQMRRWMTRTLQAEVDAGDLSEKQAIAVAGRLLRQNQLDVFDIEAKRRAVAEKLRA